MYGSLEDLFEKGAEARARQAARDTKINIALSLLADGVLGHESIARNTGLTLEEVEELDRERKQPA